MFLLVWRDTGGLGLVYGGSVQVLDRQGLDTRGTTNEYNLVVAAA